MSFQRAGKIYVVLRDWLKAKNQHLGNQIFDIEAVKFSGNFCDESEGGKRLMWIYKGLSG